MRQFDFILSEWKPLEDFNEGSEEITVLFSKDRCGSSVRGHYAGTRAEARRPTRTSLTGLGES